MPVSMALITATPPIHENRGHRVNEPSADGSLALRSRHRSTTSSDTAPPAEGDLGSRARRYCRWPGSDCSATQTRGHCNREEERPNAIQNDIPRPSETRYHQNIVVLFFGRRRQDSSPPAAVSGGYENVTVNVANACLSREKAGDSNVSHAWPSRCERVFPHTTLKPHRISQPPGEPIESQRRGKQFPFLL